MGRNIGLTQRDRAPTERDGAPTERDRAVTQRDGTAIQRDGAATDQAGSMLLPHWINDPSRRNSAPAGCPDAPPGWFVDRNDIGSRGRRPVY